MTPSRRWLSTKGSIMRRVCAIWRIQRSDITVIGDPGLGKGCRSGYSPGRRVANARRPRSVSSSLILADEPLALLAQPLDPEAHRLAGLEEDRRLLAHAHARRRAGGDHVAGEQPHEVAHVGHQLAHAEDHRPRAAVLHALAVDVAEHRQGLRIGYCVLRHYKRPDRAEGRAALALVPGAAALELVFALADVVDDRVAGDVIQRRALRNVVAAGADDDAELDLPVHLLGAARDHHVVVRPGIRAERLEEDDRLL